MSLIEVYDLERFVGARPLFTGVSFSVAKGERIGIVGRNGEGKTTLLRIIAGELEPDGGSVHIASGTSLGYLSQGLPEFKLSVFSEAMAGKPEVLDAARKMRVLEDRLRNAEDQEDLLKEYSKLQNRFEALGGYDLEHQTKEVLSGLGLPQETWELPAANLSGGQKIRLSLARLLISRPDVLLLDEPTNHLDIAGVEWLESYLSRYPGTILVVSHDRKFLDNLVGKIILVESGKVSVYRGNFTAYIRQKEEELKRQEELYRQQQELIERTRLFIQKWKANARRSGQAKSREKMLERLELVEKPRQFKKVKVSLVPSSASGKEVLEVEGLSKSFPLSGSAGSGARRDLFCGFSALILRGERVALVGPNGCGKTTFLKCILGLEPCDGKVKWGAGVKIGYFSQEFDFSSQDATLLEEVKSWGLGENAARDLLGRFLFSGDDVKKRIRDISGGERSRLALLKLVLSDANVLVLDEPTNHLDISSREALEDAMESYPGTIIFASHDRYLVDRVATKVFAFENGGITIFDGNYSSWKASRYPAGISLTSKKNRTVDGSGERKRGGGRKGKSPGGPGQSLLGADRMEETLEKTLDHEIAVLEAEILALEARQKELSDVLARPETYSSAGEPPLREWGQVKARLELLYREWESLVNKRGSSTF